MSFTAMKHLTAKWLVEMREYLADNPQFVVHGFMKAGILSALDGEDDDNEDIEEPLDDMISEDSDTDTLIINDRD
jgi:hypothetical protein